MAASGKAVQLKCDSVSACQGKMTMLEVGWVLILVSQAVRWLLGEGRHKCMPEMCLLQLQSILI